MRSHVLHWLAGYLGDGVADVLAPSWFMCIGFAGLATLILMLALSRRRGIDPGTAASAVLWCYLAAVVAGIIMPMTIDAVEHLVTAGSFRLKWSGMTSFWGYLAGAGAVVLVCRRDGVSLARFSDLAVLPLGVALVFARLGCFMAGCDYGKVSSLPWAVRFPAGSPAWRDHVQSGLIPADRAASLPVHPTQLYEALIGVAIVAIAIIVGRRLRRDGQLFTVVVVTYAIGRLGIELLRGDAGRGIYAGLSSGQIFCALVLFAVAARTLFARRRTITAIAAASLVLAVANVGEVDAQPIYGPPAPPTAQQPQDPPFGPQPEPQPPSQPQEPPYQPWDPGQPYGPVPNLSPEYQQPPAPMPRFRPRFHVSVLAGMAAPLNRRGDQVPTLAGPTLSLGYTPNWFGFWLDYDSFANDEATHGTLMASVSFAPRVTGNLTIGGRAGLGFTQVNFKDPAFRDVGAKDVRLEAILEYHLTRNWSMSLRPFSIDMIDAAELGGPITTYQFRIGVSYNFGTRTLPPLNAPLPPVQASPGPPDPPPDSGPSLEPDPPPAPEASAMEGTP